MNRRPIDNGSYWFASSGEESRELLDAQIPDDLDVAIIGAGYTGLWTAYYLKHAKPELKIVIFEANTIGFGASGRNGGWCMGWAMGIEERLRSQATMTKGMQLARAMQATVAEIARITEREGIDCHFHQGGELTVATTEFHARGMQQLAEERLKQGFSAEDFVWLTADESKSRVNMAPNFGALYTPHCAAIHPMRLVQGLAQVIQKLGVTILENTPVRSYASGSLDISNQRIKVPIILRATEGYTESIAGQSRKILPLYSMMVATEPLPESVWQDIGLQNRETFGDARRIVTYGQRTQDDRIAFGGRAGYLFGSKRKAVISPNDPHLDHVETTLRKFFPVLAGYKMTHRWGGLMGVPRHWRPCIEFNPYSGIGSAGGYTGEGVAASNLAGRILADNVAGKTSELTQLAWVGDTSRRWEPEPLRWLGAGSIQWFGDRADKIELETGKPSRFWGGLFDQFAGTK